MSGSDKHNKHDDEWRLLYTDTTPLVVDTSVMW